MRLLRIPEPFDHPQWIFEPKYDGFRALAHIDGHRCTLVSRHGHAFECWPQLAEEIAHAFRVQRAIVDGEIACLDPDGRSNFASLRHRREWPHFLAFDVLSIEGEDLCRLPLVKRKARLHAVMPRIASRIRYVDHIVGRGRDFFRVACQHDLEGIVGKWASGRYEIDGRPTSWVKVKNSVYSQMEGRRELFERRAARRRPHAAPPRLVLTTESGEQR